MLDISIPRECVYQQFDAHPGPCPRCGSDLEVQKATYLVTTRDEERMTDSFIVENDMGWFCRQCPTLVVDPRRVSEFLLRQKAEADIGREFAVVGLVGLEVIPEERKELPLGTDENPIPLVWFTNIPRGTMPD
ncbi:MAG: hypothetical protein JW900_09770 [Anaerolineae bacterium]|nr:hypothetical protein [Anaerolineae bacterium]